MSEADPFPGRFHSARNPAGRSQPGRDEYPRVLHRRLLAAAISVVLSVGVGAATADGPHLTNPTDPQQQYDATMPIPVPSTHSCTETVMTHDFQNS